MLFGSIWWKLNTLLLWMNTGPPFQSMYLWLYKVSLDLTDWIWTEPRPHKTKAQFKYSVRNQPNPKPTFLFCLVRTFLQKPELLIFPPLEKKVALKKEIDPESQHEVVLKLTEVLVTEEKARRNSIHIEVGVAGVAWERKINHQPEEFKPSLTPDHGVCYQQEINNFKNQLVYLAL